MKRICYAAMVFWAGLPALMAQAANQILGSGYTGPNVPGVSAGQVITLFVAPLNVPDAVATQIPLPTSLSGVSVSVRVVDEGETVLDTAGYPALVPILRVHSVVNEAYLIPNTAVTVQIPGNQVTVQSVPGPGGFLGNYPPAVALHVNANGVSGPDYFFRVLGAYAPHLLNSCDTVFGGVGLTVSNVNQCYPVITHADGTTVSFTNPAKAGETIVLYALGLAPSATGIPHIQQIAPSSEMFDMLFTYVLDATPQSGPTNLTAVYILPPAYAGGVGCCVDLFQINFTLPPMPPQTHISQNTDDANATIGLLTNTPAVPLFVVPN